ncbi:MAG: c-type cytochrome [Gemmatimonadales bacterium]|nr:MAG: c-type cytochrome [Gemmatimonadales bacterium]
MHRVALALPAFFLFAVFSITGCEAPEPDDDTPSGTQQETLTPKEGLGKLLFFDPMLSTPPGQACSHCHSPVAGFGNPNQQLPVSRGVHPDRYGNRNDMTASYAAHIPPRTFNEVEGLWVGGLFWDGRAASLAEQAKGPPLNPLEMANPDAEAVVAAIREAPYRDQFLDVYGEGALDDSEEAYDFMADAIAAYEMSRELNPFNSKYDLYLAGEVQLTDGELHGLALFEDEEKGNCAACHPSGPGLDGSPPLFTDYTYDNLGTPKNPENPYYFLPSEFNPDGVDYVDLGLGPVVGDSELNGFFRVPTLRNVAATSPYMHNGVFHTLYQVVSFYNSRDVAPWAGPEVAAAVNRDELGDLGLTPQEMESIVAFLKTLTDNYRADGGR